MRHTRTLLITAATALLTVAGVATPASAAPDFGAHVRDCAHDFDGTHNPGVHRGYAGWMDHMDDHMDGCP